MWEYCNGTVRGIIQRLNYITGLCQLLLLLLVVVVVMVAVVVVAKSMAVA